MDLEKKYTNIDGVECNILTLVKQDPEWAANMIQYYEKTVADLGDDKKRLDYLDKLTKDSDLSENKVELFFYSDIGWLLENGACGSASVRTEIDRHMQEGN